MDGGDIQNPVFEAPRPELGRQRQASASGTDSPAEEGPCGWGSCAPEPLQLCNDAEGYLAAHSLLAVCQGIVVNGLVNVSVSTIERRYESNSSLTGLMSAGYDIAVCILSLFVSFFGERGHKPRWLAFSAFLLGLGSLIFSLPHFISGKYHFGAKLDDTCQIPGASATNFTCSASTESSLHKYLLVFMLGQLLLGAGGTPLYTLGTAFIDDSVPKHKSSLYIGIGKAVSLLGPAIGFVLGGQLLNIYIDIQIPESTKLDQDDPRWPGARWIPFLACSFAIWLLITPVSCFPKHLPGTTKIQAEKISETHNDGSAALVENQNIGKSFKDFPVALLILLKNPVLMSLIIASSSEALVATGFVTFLPKFIENEFGKTSSFSATLGGLVLVPAAALGQIVSGILISKCKMDCKSIIKFTTGTCSVALLFSSVVLFAKCGNEPFAGVSETYNGTGVLYDLTAPCNADCRCLRSMYYPICGRDEVQYFSPCFAGCASHLFNSMKKTYHNCSCIGKPKRESDSGGFFYEAVPGKCPTQCKLLPFFLTFVFFAVVFTCMAITPTTVAILRCVPDKQRSFALGVQEVFLRLLGTIPGPILFGVAIDNSCTLWDFNECKTKGACLVYDNGRMAYLLMGISTACKIITIIFVFTAGCLYKPPSASADLS
ncbi:solute carrier organic anion transporter family member 4C1-like [Cuculus canorus]|uniref:solute carrier organic anion transporter family member 4C1-like n=1 Tax=Cuculus canorus TaxID=55661 RepID=UPI0023AAB3EF|nr:solute carrier organic anion transporter family member 4C1-like [Cuculus canorus]